MKNRVYGVIGVIGCGLLSACGGGGSGGGGAGPTPVNPPASTYPSVAGTYSFIPERVIYNCSDGAQGALNIAGFNLILEQSDNFLNAYRPPVTNPLGRIISSTGLEGLLEKDGSFSLQQVARVEQQELGEALVVYYIGGKFSSAGWSGNYEYEVTSSNTVYASQWEKFVADRLLGKDVLPGYTVYTTCKYKTTFRGERVHSTSVSYSHTMTDDYMPEEFDSRMIRFNPYEGMGKIAGEIILPSQ